MSLGFPSNPTVGQLYTTSSGTTYQWDGTAWNIYVSASPTYPTITATSITIVGNTSTLGGAQIITSATIYQYISQANTSSGINNIVAGTDTAVVVYGSTATIWNTSTLQSVTGRGNSTTSTIFINNYTNSTGTTTGALVVSGGVGIGKDLWLGGNLYFSSAQGVISASQVVITGTTNSTSTTTGSLIVDGGVGIAKDLWLGGNLFFSNAQGTINANQVVITGQTNATSTATGSLIVDGGVGIAKDVWIGGQLYLNNHQVLTTASFFSVVDSGPDILITATVTTPSVLTISNISTLESVTQRGSVTDQVVYFTNPTQSTGTSTGAFIVSSGAAVQGNFSVGGALQFAASNITSSQIVINTTATTVIDIYNSLQYRSAKYLIQVESGGGYNAKFETIEILLLVDSLGTVYSTEYAILSTNGELGEFSADVEGDNNVRLYFTPFNLATTTIKILRITMSAF